MRRLRRKDVDLESGVVGTTSSGKTSLVHRYLTGTFTAEESPEGGRFKKEVFIDGLSHLLLIRDEGSASPDVQFSLWADAVIFVYSVDNQESFERVRHFYSHMNKFRNVADMPVLLVGTKDTLSEKNPRVITEEEGKQMANHLKRCAYYETCATYGLNVERVFKDACCKILQQRIRASFSSNVRTPTPTTPAAQDKRDYQESRFMQNVLYGSVPAQKATYHQRSISSAPLAEQFVGGSRKSQVHQRESAGSVGAQRCGERAMSAFVVPPGMSAQAQFGSRASQLDCRGISPSNSQKNMSNGSFSETLVKVQGEFDNISLRAWANNVSHPLFHPGSLFVEEILESKMIFMFEAEPLTHNNYRLFQFFFFIFCTFEDRLFLTEET
ncbi:hypothetical protein Y032_0584g311 [Ancylostoma ceylanicum]|uniref:GTP-binding domain protein n=1 Tax=Ancylostoma ceylanicum TaxID=53326 RepID=A0A016WNB0_9BILA|nr:hypothetical protein Y032_0584g311 [Ancylostoma ceylanicum]